MELTKEQNYVLEEILKFKKPIQKIGGYAGTGKSFLISYLLKKLPNFAVCSFTGKAANVLRKKGILSASTIHSLIYKPLLNEYGKIVLDSNGSPIFVLTSELPCMGIIVDEASMVGKDIYNDLVSFNIPLILIGDHGQLEPISNNINLMKELDYRLETIHRNAGEIAFFAEFIRNGYRPSAWKFKGGNKVHFLGKSEAKEYFTKVDQIICAYNKTRVMVNEITRIQLGREGNWPVIGDRVMCLQNNKEKGLFNGMQGIVTKRYTSPKNKMRFLSDNFEYDVLFNPQQFNKEKYDFGHDRDDPHPFDFCFAITAHKSQGDQWPNVMVLEQKCKMWSHQRWAYTSASRAEENVIWVENY